MIQDKIRELVQYGLLTGLVSAEDEIYTTNRLLELFRIEDYPYGFGEKIEQTEEESVKRLPDLLTEMMDYAVENGIMQEDGIVYRDLFDTKIMSCLVGRPSEIIRRFHEEYEKSPEAATDFFYKFSQDTDYIRRYRVCRDEKWVTPTKYGDLDITINLSKPEKDPKAIASARLAKQGGYPKCLLCVENEGYAGRINHPARQNHRIIPIRIDGKDWGFQYSPYVYYNEHCIVFNGEHTPMKIDKACFAKLLDFVRQFPHYFVGSNADLPIVGGSILAHDHFQGGHYTFAMERAPVEEPVRFRGFDDIRAGIVKWPMSVIRLSSYNRASLSAACAEVLKKWRAYTDEQAGIFAQTDGIPHNTITPIARMNGSQYECDLVLRNNITSEDRPLGIFHPAPALHHIKKENIGLIEVMGLAVLPARLATELSILRDAMLSGADIAADERIASHADWAKEVLAAHPEFNADNAMDIIHAEVGKVFGQVLEDAGVFKRTESGKEAFKRFVSTL